ncbi:hypothetical protein ACFXTH_035586 [Malus domestica]
MCHVSFLLHCVGVSTSFLVSSWTKPGQDQVIGLCGQDELGRGPSIRIITRYDGKARLIKATRRRASLQEETA